MKWFSKNNSTETNGKQKLQEVHNIVILDKSGSMASIARSTVDGLNEVINSVKSSQKENQDTQKHFITIVAFCDCGLQKIMYNTPAADAKCIKYGDYTPCCLTPLYDAIGNVLTREKNEIADKENITASVTVITDGYENASREYTLNDIQILINSLKEEGWDFRYMGTEHDIDKVADSLNIGYRMEFSKNPDDTRKAWEMQAKREESYNKKRRMVYEMAQEKGVSAKAANKCMSEMFAQLDCDAIEGLDVSVIIEKTQNQSGK